MTKFKFAKQDVPFAGFDVKPDGFAPSSELLQAIKNFPTPHTLTDAWPWYGLVNQMTWAEKLQPVMEPFRELLQRAAKFQWTAEMEKLFHQSRYDIVETIFFCVQILNF